MIIHSRALHDIGKPNPYGVELSLVQQQTGLRAWESCNCYPRRGITLGLWDFNKPEILGNGYSASIFIEPVFGGWNKWSFSLKGAFGIAWLTNPYHPETNPYNFSYSTNIAFPLNLGSTVNYEVSNHVGLNFTLIYNHISNGGLKEPNKGINWPTVALGIDFKPTPYHLEKRKKEKTDFGKEQRNAVRFDLFLTLKQLNHDQLAKYFIGGLIGTYSYRLGKLNAITIGTQFEWDESDREEISRIEGVNADFKKFSILGGHEFLLGKFIFGQDIGVYLYDQYKINDPVFQRYDLNYSITKRLSAGMLLKAHRHVADYLAFNLRLKLI